MQKNMNGIVRRMQKSGLSGISEKNNALKNIFGKLEQFMQAKEKINNMNTDWKKLYYFII